MKKRNRLSLVVLVMLLSGCLTACGSSDSVKSESMDMTTGNSGNDLYYEDSYENAWDTEITESDTGSVAANRKLIKTVDLTAETYEFDKLVGTVEAKVSSLGGYIESSSIHTQYDNLKYGDFVIRIPVRELDRFVSEVSEISNITDRDSSQKDVTLSYVDLESHKNALEAEEESLLRLLESATSIEDIITLQSRLTDVRYQIESMESQLRTMDNLIDFATINLYIDEVETYTPVVEPSMGERIRTGFNESLEDLGNGFKNLFVFLIVNSPFLVIWAIIIVVAVIVIRLIIKSAIKKGDENAKRREQEMREMQMRVQQPQRMNGVPNMPSNMPSNMPPNMPPNMPQNIPQNELQNGRNNGQQ